MKIYSFKGQRINRGWGHLEDKTFMSKHTFTE